MTSRSPGSPLAFGAPLPRTRRVRPVGVPAGIRSRTFDAFFPLVMIALLYFLISWVLLQFLEYLERVTDPKYGREGRRT